MYCVFHRLIDLTSSLFKKENRCRPKPKSPVTGGVTPSRVAQLVKVGCPTDSLAAAISGESSGEPGEL